MSTTNTAAATPDPDHRTEASNEVATPVTIVHHCYNGCPRTVANRGDECATCAAYRVRMNVLSAVSL